MSTTKNSPEWHPMCTPHRCDCFLHITEVASILDRSVDEVKKAGLLILSKEQYAWINLDNHGSDEEYMGFEMAFNYEALLELAKYFGATLNPLMVENLQNLYKLCRHNAYME